VSKRILITDYVWPNVDPEKRILNQINADVIVAPDPSEETLINLSKDVDGILTCFAKVTKNVVEAAKNCVVIGRYGVGTDNISVETATNLGIIVTYVPDYCTEEVSDHTIGMILSWNRKITFHNNDTKAFGWGNAGLGMRIMRLSEKTLGIIGFGRIGQSVARKAKAFGMNVVVYSPSLQDAKAKKNGVEKVSIEALLKTSHFVSLHAPLNEKTQGMIGEKEISLMRSDAILINCARGGLINEKSLYTALTKKYISGVALDVMMDIQPDLDNKIIQLENTLITPHTAFFSQESVLELQEKASTSVAEVLQGKMPQNVYNQSVLSHARVKI